MRHLSHSLAQYFGTPVRVAATKAPKAPPVGRFSVADLPGRTREKNDCSVRAMATATGRPYAECYAALEAAGRLKGRGVTLHVLGAALGLPFVSAPRVPGRTRLRVTYAQWLEAHPKGTYIVFVTGHFAAVIDGVQYDLASSLYKPRARMWGHWEVAA